MLERRRCRGRGRQSRRRGVGVVARAVERRRPRGARGRDGRAARRRRRRRRRAEPRGDGDGGRGRARGRRRLRRGLRGAGREPCGVGAPPASCGDCAAGSVGAWAPSASACWAADDDCGGACGGACAPCGLGEACASDADCAWEACEAGACVEPRKACFGGCGGRGACVVLDVLEGFARTDAACYAGDSWCDAACLCDAGFYGAACEFGADDYAAAVNVTRHVAAAAVAYVGLTDRGDVAANAAAALRAAAFRPCAALDAGAVGDLVAAADAVAARVDIDRRFWTSRPNFDTLELGQIDVAAAARAHGLANATSGVDLLGAVGDLRVGVLACAATDGATVARSTMAGLLDVLDDATRYVAVAAASAASPGGFELAIADAAADAAKFGDRGARAALALPDAASLPSPAGVSLVASVADVWRGGTAASLALTTAVSRVDLDGGRRRLRGSPGARGVAAGSSGAATAPTLILKNGRLDCAAAGRYANTTWPSVYLDCGNGSAAAVDVNVTDVGGDACLARTGTQPWAATACAAAGPAGGANVTCACDVAGALDVAGAAGAASRGRARGGGDVDGERPASTCSSRSPRAAASRRPRARGDRLPVQEQRRLLEASRRDAVLEGWAGAWLRAVWEGHTHVSFVTTRRPDEPRTTRAAGLLVDWLAAYAVAGLCYRLLVFPGGPACGDSDGDRAGCLRLDRPAGGRRCFYEASSRRCYDRAPTADDAYLPPALVAVALVAVAALVPLAEAWDWFYERYLTVAVPEGSPPSRGRRSTREPRPGRVARAARVAPDAEAAEARAPAAPAAAAGRDQPSWREKRGGGGERGGAKRGGGVGLSLHNPVAAPAPASALEAACVEVQDALRDLERGAWLGGLDYAARHRLREGLRRCLRRTRAKLCADWACHAPDALVRRCYWRLLVAHGEAEAWGRVLERCGSAREAELQLLEFCHLERLDARRLALYRKVHGDTARPYGQRRARAPRTLDAVVLAWVAVAAACGAAAALLLRAVVATRAAHGHRAVRSWFRIAMLGRVVTLCFLDPLSLLVFRVLLPGALACAEFNHLLRSEKSRRALLGRRAAGLRGYPGGLATAFDQLAPAAHRRAVNAAFCDDSLRWRAGPLARALDEEHASDPAWAGYLGAALAALLALPEPLQDVVVREAAVLACVGAARCLRARGLGSLAAFAAVLLGSLGALALGFFALERWRRRGDDPELAADGEHDQTYEQYLAAVIIARQAREATLQTAERRFLRFKRKGAPAPAPAPAVEPAR
ncbi:hypothetical protein JL722_6557 [Aureococcus anophagefferens]|nr:hypothetical protein JL722_6557 [Aureococcus anophagefferens]